MPAGYPSGTGVVNHIEISIVESSPEIVIIRPKYEEVENFSFSCSGSNGGSDGSVDLSHYYTKFEIDQFLSNIYTKSEVQVLLSLYYTKSEIDEKLENLVIDCGTY